MLLLMAALLLLIPSLGLAVSLETKGSGGGDKERDDYRPVWGWGPEGDAPGRLVLEEMRLIQREQLAGRVAGEDVGDLRAVVCKTAGGIGNRIQASGWEAFQGQNSGRAPGSAGHRSHA